MFQIATLSPEQPLNTDLLVIFLDEAYCKKPDKIPGVLAEPFNNLISRYLKLKDFSGSLKETLVLYPESRSDVKRIALIGTGKKSEYDPDSLLSFGFTAAKMQQQVKARTVHLLPGSLHVFSDVTVRNILEGIRYQRYRFEKYKSKPENPATQARFILLSDHAVPVSRLRKIIKKTGHTMDSVDLARNLSDLPSNDCTPEIIRKMAEKHFSGHKNITVSCLDAEKLKKLKMNAIRAVAKGSREHPLLLLIHYKPDKPVNKRLAVIGKGVTFDSGGISIKPSSGMEEMKYDVSGGAATIGILDAVSFLKPGFEVIGVVPLVENMPGSFALKPGDVIRTYSGKTVEIINTDAEGRLILADAIAYTEAIFKPGIILDLATLTGSIMAALGDKAAGVFSNDEELKRCLVDSGERCGDRLWPMPTWDIYKEELKSHIADIKNLGGKWGGAISAAKFLEFFVTHAKWAHIDMAGTANDVKDREYLDKGATGYGTRLVLNALDDFARLL